MTDRGPHRPTGPESDELATQKINRERRSGSSAEEPPHRKEGWRVPNPRFASRYEPGMTIGRGGMGEVCLVLDTELEREVALKRMLPGLPPGAQNVFVREAVLQGRLEHPSVVPVYEGGVDPEGRTYFTMKRVNGTGLDEILEKIESGDEETRRNYSQRHLLGVLAQVSLAVDFAHRKGVLHRDLKPANIMLGEFGEVYVLDWGLAKATEAEAGGTDSPARGSSMYALGTPGYASPEQIRRDWGRVCPQSDVWSLGVMLYRILTGRPYIQPGTLDEMILATQGPPDPRPSVVRDDLEVAPEFDRICTRALEIDPEDRHVSARAFQEEIQAMLDGERDAELRHELAEQHAESAAREARKALTDPGTEALHARRDAFREIGKALGLEPGHRGAMGSLTDLIRTPPRFIPPEVQQEIEALHRGNLRRAMSWLAVAYAVGFVGALGLFAWTGIYDVKLAIGILAAITATGIAATINSLPGNGTRPGSYAVVIFGVINIALQTRLGGPVLWVPALSVALIYFVAHTHERTDRTVFIVLIALGFFVPVILEQIGVLPNSYIFEGGQMRVKAQLVPLREFQTIIGLCFITVLSCLGAIAVARTRDSLTEQETARAVLGWQLKHLAGETEDSPFAHEEGRRKTLW